MKDRKIRMKSSTGTKVVSKYIREGLDELINNDKGLELQRFAHISSGTKDYEEEFHQLYVQPLVDCGLSLDESLAMLVESVLLPN